MDNYTGHRYHVVEDVPVITWAEQGTIYNDPAQAKYAAAKLFCNVSGVVVKRHASGGWTLRYWR